MVHENAVRAPAVAEVSRDQQLEGPISGFGDSKAESGVHLGRPLSDLLGKPWPVPRGLLRPTAWRRRIGFLVIKPQSLLHISHRKETVVDTIHCDTLVLNGTQLYCERRGSGAPVLFISGAFGDSGAWWRVTTLLSSHYTTVCYDRRGNSRSPAPPNWNVTSLEEQAGDAAALIEHLGLGPALVWGSSLGGAIGLTLAQQRGDLVRQAVLHEPIVSWLLDDPTSASGPLITACQSLLEVGDLRGAAEAMIRLADGDDVYVALASDQRERMLGNAQTLFGVEQPALAAIRDNVEVVPTAPVSVVKGSSSPRFLTVGADRLGQVLGTGVKTIAGGHVPQATHPHAVANLVRALSNAADCGVDP